MQIRTLAASIEVGLVGLVGCSLSGTVGIVTEGSSTGGESTSSESGSNSNISETGLLDVPTGLDLCKDGIDGIGDCDERSPPPVFDGRQLWAWNGPENFEYSFVTPLVANLTDDNGDGFVDLCDVPDVVVVAGPEITGAIAQAQGVGHIFIIDGQTGALHTEIDAAVHHTFTPALGDLDGDGVVEIVAVRDAAGADLRGRVVAFSPDGAELWESAPFSRSAMGAVAIANLDAVGPAEAMVDRVVVDDRGDILLELPDARLADAVPVAVDLDRDGDLEVLWGRSAYHHTGGEYFDIGGEHGYAAVGDLDDDDDPEIVLTRDQGLSLLEHDGTATILDFRPTLRVLGMDVDVPAGEATWKRPAAIHDINGDGRREIVLAVANYFAVIEVGRPASFSALWATEVSDLSGGAGGTAFGFLGDRGAQVAYADERELRLFDIGGTMRFNVDRTSITLQELPTVADVNNDGSADVVVTANHGFSGSPSATVRAFGGVNGLWVAARRIWNQHTYHVTNVGEDGSIPTQEQPHWIRINTFRTNVRIDNGIICAPDPEP